MADRIAEALAVRDLTVVRGGRTVVERVSFTARFGVVTGLLGPNGAGKSSLLKALAGVLPYEGEIAVRGTAARALEASERARRIAYVPQQSELRAALSVVEVVDQGRYAHRAGRLRSTSADREIVQSALAATGTEGLADRPFPALSQGERQRVLLARALASEARVLLLDEPTAALDVGHALALYALLRELAAGGHAIVVVLHPLEQALEWTDEVLLLERGRARACGPTATIIRRGPIESIYGVTLVPNGALGFRLNGARIERDRGAEP